MLAHLESRNKVKPILVQYLHIQCNRITNPYHINDVNVLYIKGLAIIRRFIYAGIYTNLFLLVLGGSIDSAVYIPVSMLPPSTSRNELVYIPA